MNVSLSTTTRLLNIFVAALHTGFGTPQAVDLFRQSVWLTMHLSLGEFNE